MTYFQRASALACLCLLVSVPSLADTLTQTRPSGHAPIGVMGDHLHKRGEWMVSYRFMQMNMSGNRIGTNSISPDEIATTQPNIFFDRPMQPPTLRIVPLDMTMRMHMFGAMYGLSDDVTLMAMVNYETRVMDHVVYQGGMGTNVRGNFTTQAKGFGDTRLAALVRLWSGMHSSVHATAGLSLPTGSIGQRDDILTPMNMRPQVRLPYAMQLGSGTYDLMPALTYTSHDGHLAWGAQYSGIIRLGDNDASYTLGDQHQLTAWAGYDVTPWAAPFIRMSARTWDRIDGQDPQIAGPVQTANPDNYGGEDIRFGFGLNLLGTTGALKGHRIAAEVEIPLYRDLNGPQMETDITFTLGYQKAF